jgi:hypothetical protein
LQSSVTERAYEYAVVHFGRAQVGQEWLNSGVTFQVEVEALLPKLLERIDHAHDLVWPSFGLNALKVAPTELANQSCGIGDAVESIVVKQHRNPVASDLHVGFEVPVSQVNRMSETRTSVLDGFKGATSVSHCRHAGAIEVWMTGRHASEPTQTLAGTMPDFTHEHSGSS